MPLGKVYLIPNILHEDNDAYKTLPAYVLDAIKDCNTFFVENEKVARRYYKKLWKEIKIDDYNWYVIHKAEENVKENFLQALQIGDNVGIVSDAGCPGIADPGQILIEAAQNMGAKIHPLVGPSSILLALMASGMNGQQFYFHGYLPIDTQQRKSNLRRLEEDSLKTNCTHIFIETPYRNNALLNDIFAVCKANTKLCIAVDITAMSEFIVTKSIQQWQQDRVDINKRPAIFLLSAG